MKNFETNIELINYRREKARDTLADAKSMLHKVSLFTIVNRIYYATFYEVTAILLTRGLSSSKHSGIRSIFNREFIKRGIVKEEFGVFFNKISEFRQKGDYGDFVIFEKERVEEWLTQAENFISALEDIISEIT